VAVIGSGFAGSLCAMIAHRLGHDVVVLERDRHPRFAIGESSTPLANLLLESLATRYELPQLLPFSKWGSWQQTHPEVACGLKRGFTFLHHSLRTASPELPDRAHQLFVAASPRDEIADTHWYRADFDAFFARAAQELGVTLLDTVKLDCFEPDAAGAIIQGSREDARIRIRAKFVIDATGPRGFLYRAMRLGEIPSNALPSTEALFAHFVNVDRLTAPRAMINGQMPPFPIDDAAVHHVFDGGWIWVLRFNNGITSAGIAATRAFAARLQLRDGKPAWERLLELIPVLRAQFSNARPVFDFIHLAPLSFRSEKAVGPRWALLPSAVGFVDPLLSTGFPLTLLGIERIAEALSHEVGSAEFIEHMARYERQTHAEFEATERLIGALYASMSDFPLFAALTLLYFAAASFGETARRLGRMELAQSFLLHDTPNFGPRMRECCERARAPMTPAARDDLIAEIYRAIAPIDVAGLSERARHHWFPVTRQDLLASAGKLNVSRDAIVALLNRIGFG
jgi:FADH2 O2-dependent halogenase